MTHRLVPLADTHVDGLHDLINRTYRADRVPMAMARDEVIELLDAPYLVPPDDGRVVLVGDRVVGYLLMRFRPSGERDEHTFLMGTVDADHRRQGIGSALLEWGIARSEEKLGQIANDLPRTVEAEAYPWQGERLALLARFGMGPARYFHETIRPLDSLPELETNGFELEAWTTQHNNEARQVFNDSFQDHWGSTPADAQSWQYWLTGHGARLDLSFLAKADGQIIGLCLNAHYPDDEAVHGRREGYIESLGTLRDYRKKGVASALLVASFRAFAAEGFTHAALGVDTDSPTGADSLYTGMGFVTDRQLVLLQRKLD